MAHHSLLRESLVPTSSPLRKKSMLCLSTSNTNLRQNDDYAERLERRRTAENEMRQRDSSTPSPSDKRKSVGGSIAGLSPGQLAEHYANCIKLSAENKINTKNAFSLQLIDYMAMMLKKRDSKMDNFQVASCTLDASTKIYAYRVDSVHTDVLKMAIGLAAGSRKKNANEDEEQGGGDEGDRNSEKVSSFTLRKKRSRKLKNTIASNVETLNAKPDLDYGKNFFFLQSVGNLNDCQPGGCHFLSSLKVRNDCSLTLCSDRPFWDPRDNDVPENDVTVPLPPIPDLRNKSICSVFSQFHFTSWSLDADEERNSSQTPRMCSDNDFAFDMNAVPEPVPICDNDLAVENFQESDDDVDSDGEEALVACAAGQRGSAPRVVDLRKHLLTSPGEYSYFRAGALELWAGPSHWKYRCKRFCDGKAAKEGNAGNKKQKSKQKKEEVINFESEDLCMMALESNKESLKLTKRTIEKGWCAQKNTYPPDMHYDCKNFKQLQIRRLIVIALDPVPVEDRETPVYDYENDHDTTEYCPNIAGDVTDTDDGACGEGDFLVGQHQDVHTNLAMEGTGCFGGDNLVVPPNKVARIFIPYAQRAKTMDMKRLKAAIWEILVNAEKWQEMRDREKLKVEEPVKFSYLYSCLPSYLPSNLADNLSAQLALVALLHLANEKTLHIQGKENLDDLIISQS